MSNQEQRPMLVAVCSAFSNFLADITMYPMEVVTNKIRTFEHPTNVRECTLGIWKSEGIFVN